MLKGTILRITTFQRWEKERNGRSGQLLKENELQTLSKTSSLQCIFQKLFLPLWLVVSAHAGGKVSVMLSRGEDLKSFYHFDKNTGKEAPSREQNTETQCLNKIGTVFSVMKQCNANCAQKKELITNSVILPSSLCALCSNMQSLTFLSYYCISKTKSCSILDVTSSLSLISLAAVEHTCCGMLILCRGVAVDLRGS